MMLLAALGLSFPAFSQGLPTNEFTSGLGVQVHPPHWLKDPEGTIRRIRSAGFTWIREELTWTTIEPRRGAWNDRYFDPIMDAARAQGIRVMAVLAYGNPAYSGRSDKTGPTTAADRAAFVRYAVRTVGRYKGRGVIWEIWNEPDWKFWMPDSDAGDYVQLAKETARAIRAKYPGERIAGPALSTMNPSWLEKAFGLGLLEALDIVTVHPYRQDRPELSGENLYRARTLVRQYGKGRRIPVLVSEWGYSEAWTPNGRRLGGERAGIFASRVHASALSEGSPLSIHYDWQDDGDDASEPEHRFGLLRRNGSWKPGLEAISTISSQLEGFTYAGRLAQPTPRGRVAIFRRGSDVRLLGLRETDESGFLELPGPVARYRRQPGNGPGEVGDESARGFDPAEPRVLAGSDDPVVFSAAEGPDPDLAALGRYPLLPSVLGAWSVADTTAALRRVVNAIPTDATRIEIGERSPSSATVRWHYRGPASSREAAIVGAGDKMSRTGRALLVLRIKLPGARAMAVETLLR